MRKVSIENFSRCRRKSHVSRLPCYDVCWGYDNSNVLTVRHASDSNIVISVGEYFGCLVQNGTFGVNCHEIVNTINCHKIVNTIVTKL